MLRTRAPGNAAPTAATAPAVTASPASTTARAPAFTPRTPSTSDNAEGTALIKLPRQEPPPLPASASRFGTISMLPPAR